MPDMIPRPAFLPRPPLVAVLPLSGVIAAAVRPGAGGMLNDQGLAPMVERAFTRGKPAAVALAINSPGGSPAQSSLIGARIRRLAEEKSLPVFAFVEDVAASGGYWLATAADEIFVDPTSIVGSIGVISAGFGFHELIGRWGIERRLYTAGEDKSLLDPFRPERAEDVARLKRIQGALHRVFIDQVQARRGARLRGADLFTGDVWIGREAVENGLADAVGHLVPEMKARFGDKTRFAVYGRRRGWLPRLRLGGLSEGLGAIEARAAWARYGV
jgi:signal peptide peptidase SppA